MDEKSRTGGFDQRFLKERMTRKAMGTTLPMPQRGG